MAKQLAFGRRSIAMRTLLVSTAALAAGFVFSAVAANAPTESNGCGPSGMSAKTSHAITQSGFTDVKEVPKAVIVHAIDPDGNPVVMVLAPAE
jgi:hypothetical protein